MEAFWNFMTGLVELVLMTIIVALVVIPAFIYKILTGTSKCEEKK